MTRPVPRTETSPPRPAPARLPPCRASLLHLLDGFLPLGEAPIEALFDTLERGR